MTKVNILEEVQPTTITLADGKEYLLPPKNMNTLANLEEEFDCGILQINELLQLRPMTTLRKLFFILLKENHPKLTIKDVGLLVSPSHITSMTMAATEILKYGFVDES